MAAPEDVGREAPYPRTGRRDSWVRRREETSSVRPPYLLKGSVMEMLCGRLLKGRRWGGSCKDLRPPPEHWVQQTIVLAVTGSGSEATGRSWTHCDPSLSGS